MYRKILTSKAIQGDLFRVMGLGALLVYLNVDTSPTSVMIGAYISLGFALTLMVFSQYFLRPQKKIHSQNKKGNRS